MLQCSLFPHPQRLKTLGEVGLDLSGPRGEEKWGCRAQAAGMTSQPGLPSEGFRERIWHRGEICVQ